MINSNYIERNLVAYIGNKRRLLDLIKKAILKTDLIKDEKNHKFLDLFSGTGVVSRLAKNLGFEVYVNDWEYYSYVMNKVFIELDNLFLKNSFRELGGIENTIKILNSLESIDEKDRYISKFYCPENDDNPNLENERLFWTNYNGRKIDAMRAKIESWKIEKLINEKEELFLIALLLYEASTRSNTSGVFKGFHNGFGGTNGDALTRILKKIELKVPELIDGKKTHIFNRDAVQLSEELKDIEFDITYLDPPYNQHQYGSNYHLLNTIALNDKPPVNKDIIINDKKVNKSAIRKDWIKTKSTFCYKKSASNDFKKIVENINSHYILVSYSTDGIIPFSEMLEILSNKGQLSIEISEYVKFRGGKQALTTQVNNIEFVLVVDTTKKSQIGDIENVNKRLILEKINLITKKTINPLLAEMVGFRYKKEETKKRYIEKKYNDVKIAYNLDNRRVIKENNDDFFSLPLELLKEILKDMEFMTNITKEDEIYLLLKDIENRYLSGDTNEIYDYFKKIPYLLSKFNNKKAYGASLKSIYDILRLINETFKIFIDFDLLNDKHFAKLEKIILTKINFKSKEDHSSIKSKIAKEYELLIKNLEKKADIIDKKIPTSKKQINNYIYLGV